jgi:polyisoprenoid-binding protein YceI
MVLRRRVSLVKLLLGMLIPGIAPAAGPAIQGLLEIESGSAAFEATTNVPGVGIKGKSTALTGHVALSRGDGGLNVSEIDAALPVRSLSTGMKVRDEHMRKYIFTAGDSQLPDVRFSAASIACPVNGSAQEFRCQVSGELSIRGMARPFAMLLHVREQSGASAAFHGTGDAVVRLSDYGIAAPSQFGVTASNEVKLHIDFSVRERPAAAPAGGAR